MKATALVTGATGFVGNAVARVLLKQNREVRVLLRRSSDTRLLQGLPVEKFYGDLGDTSVLKLAVRGCQEVYHVAAQYSFFNPNPDLIYQSNVQGTHNILQACMGAKVDKVVYTSTVGAVGIPQNGSPGDEETPITLLDCKGHYKRSKFLAEQEAFSFVRRGLPVVIVNPSAPIGFGDIKPTPTGKLILDFLNRKMPAYIDTGLNLIDVEDVAMGHILAAEKGSVGRRYILGNQNLHLREILEILAAITGRKAPRVKIPFSIALGAAHVSEAWAKLSKKPPSIEVEAVWLGKKKMFFSPDRAIRELGLPQTEIRIALKKAIKWYLDNGYVKENIVKHLNKLDLKVSP